ncbi:hypothetical protein PMAYCL1PPCAC_13387, partial [Pristionchus mayeri]
DGFFTTPKDPVRIDFYDKDYVKPGENCDITAHLRIEQSCKWPVYSNSYVNGQWQNEEWREQPLDVIWTKGWYRVDVSKHDEFRMNVFFQGFWSDVRTFGKSLNNLRSVYVLPPHVDLNYVTIDVKLRSEKFVPLSVDKMY